VVKPLQVNPFKLSSPMGATLAFLGVSECMPLMHGAQGCASFTKVLFTRHFNEPIAIQTTAVTDISAVLDGGDKQISEAVINITKKVTPKLIGLFSTGLTETKGDDLKGVAKNLTDYKIVYVNSPDYEGGLQDGFALSVKAMIEQLTFEQNSIDESKALIIPNVNFTALEVEKLKEFVEGFGYKVLALPDISNSLDGYLGEKQGTISGGGISVEEIENLANSFVVITVGESVRDVAKALISKNSNIKHIHTNSLNGLVAVDEFVEELLKIKKVEVPFKIKRWRARLQDAMLDAHFIVGRAKVALAGEADYIYGVAKALAEVGAEISLAVSSTDSEILKEFNCEVLVGDFEDIENRVDKFNLLIGNSHAEKLAHKHHKTLILRGYPNYEEIGVLLKSDILYEGSCNFLFEVANSLIKS